MRALLERRKRNLHAFPDRVQQPVRGGGRPDRRRPSRRRARHPRPGQRRCWRVQPGAAAAGAAPRPGVTRGRGRRRRSRHRRGAGDGDVQQRGIALQSAGLLPSPRDRSVLLRHQSRVVRLRRRQGRRPRHRRARSRPPAEHDAPDRARIDRAARPARLDRPLRHAGRRLVPLGLERDDVVAAPAVGHRAHRSRIRAARRDGHVHGTDGSAPRAPRRSRSPFPTIPPSSAGRRTGSRSTPRRCGSPTASRSP